MAENFSNDFQTTLAAPIANDVVTAISVVSATGAPAANFRIRVGNELMLVTSKGSGTDWTVTRGIEGTTAAAHVAGTLLVHVVTTGGFQQYITEQLTGGSVAASFASLVVAGALTASGLTQGSVPFIGASGVISQDNANLFWDNTNKRLGVADNTPSFMVDIGAANGTGTLLNVKGAAAFYHALTIASSLGATTLGIFPPSGTTMAISNFSGPLSFQDFSSGHLQFNCKIYIGTSNPTAPAATAFIQNNLLVGGIVSGSANSAPPTGGAAILGRVLLGYQVLDDTSSRLQVAEISDTLPSVLHLLRARGAAIHVPAVIVSGDVLGRIRFSGYDGAAYQQMASIDVVSTGTIASGRVPTYMAFSTATDAAPSVLSEVARFTSAGLFALGGGGTSSFPAVKRNAAEMEVKLADDSAFTYLKAKLRASDNAAGANFSGAVANITVVDGVVTAAS